MNNKKEYLQAFILIALSTFISHFLFFRDFGLYEDDYYNIPPYFNLSFSSLFEIIKVSTVNWLQGRPLSFMPYFFTMIGFKAGGISGLYAIAFIINTVNSFLVYLIIKKVLSNSELFALSGAVLFCLFPSDTTKTLLIHSFLYQMSMMFFLSATLIYIKGFKKISYAVIILSLLSYEPAFILFFAVPFLNTDKDKPDKKSILIHFSIMTLILFFSYFYRKFAGETRVDDLSSNIGEYIFKSGVSMLSAPLINFYLFLRAPLIPVLNFDIFILIVVAILFTILFIVFRRLNSDDSEKSSDFTINLIHKRISLKLNLSSSRKFIRSLILFPVSLLFICIAYALSFTHYPPTAVTGRLTSVHLAASFGGSLFFASLLSVIYEMFSKTGKRNIFVLLISLYLSLLAGYGIVIQKDFTGSWKNQKNFWTEVIKICPDIIDGTLIILENNGKQKLPYTNYILSNSWADPIILQRIFKFPEEWINPPRLFVLNNGLESRVKIENDTLKWKVPESTTFSHWETLPDSNFILLSVNERKEIIRTDSQFVSLKCKNFFLKPKTQSMIQNYDKSILYDLLIMKQEK